MFALGCQVLFPNDAVAMILARMIGMLGPIQSEMLVMGQETHKYFTEEYDLYYSNEVCHISFSSKEMWTSSC